MKDDLPLALVVEKGKCGVSEDDGNREDNSESFEEPAWIDDFGLRRGALMGWWSLAYVALGGFWHESLVQAPASHARTCGEEWL
jgi:hypothetical protein